MAGVPWSLGNQRLYGALMSSGTDLQVVQFSSNRKTETYDSALVIQRSSSSGVERALFFGCAALGRTQALEALGPEGAGDRHVPGSLHPRLHPQLGGEQPQPPSPPIGKD